MIDRRHIGWRSAASSVVVDAWRVRLFCQAIGETDRVHWDQATARAAGHPACPVPPTFLKALESDHCPSATLLHTLEVPMQRVLHVEQGFSWHAPVFVGDTVEISRQVSDIHDKRGGALSFIVVQTRFHVAGREVCQSEQTLLVRNGEVADA